MTLNYKGYLIDYLDKTGDAAVYKDGRMIMHVSLSRWLSSREVIDNLLYVFKLQRFPGTDEADYTSDFIYTGEEAC